MSDQLILDRLISGYEGDLPIRALWAQAGGDPVDVVYGGSSAERWASMWNAALADGERVDLGLVRELLLDRPGDPELLEVVLAEGGRGPEEERAAARFAVDFLEAAESPLEPIEGWALLQLVPAVEGPTGFALLAVATEGRLSPVQREGAEAWLSRIVEGELPPDDVEEDSPARPRPEAPFLPTLAGVGRLIPRLLSFLCPADDEGGEDPCVDALAGLLEDAKAWSLEPGPLDADGAREARESLEAAIESLAGQSSPSPGAESLADRFAELAGSLAAFEEDEGEPVAPRARALVLALWATRPDEAQEEGEAE